MSLLIRGLLTLTIAIGPATCFADDEDPHVEIVCVDEAGEPVVAAEVYLFQNQGGEEGGYVQFGPFHANMQGKVKCPTALFTDEEGHFDRFIYARVPDSLVGVARSVSWKSGTTHNDDAKVTLHESQQVGGTVDVPGGFAPADVKVRVRTMHVRYGPEPFDYDSLPRTERFEGLNTALPEIFEAVPDMTGKFTLRDVPKKGRLCLITVAEGLAESQWMNPGQVFERDILLAVDEEGIARGVVKSPEGMNLEGILVTARLSSRGRLSPKYLTTFSTTTDADGRFELRGLPHTEFVLAVTDPEARWAIQPREDMLIPSAGEKTLDVQLEESVTISGQVVDSAGEPVPHAALSILADSKESPGLDDDVTDEEGRYELSVPSGPAKIYFNALPNGFVYPRPQIIKNLDIRKGQENISNLDFTLERDD